MQNNPVFEVLLSNLIYGGNALGRLPDGRVVFVPFALPDEKVLVRLVEEKRSHVRGELVEILQPSAARVKPLCVHYTVCGGCHYQHMAYAAQLGAKTQIIRDQLERIGGIANPGVNQTVASPQEWYYRNSIQFHLDVNGKLGFLAQDSHTIVPVTECHLPEDPLNALWPRLDFEAIPSLERVELRLGVNEEMMLVLNSNDLHPPELNIDLPLSVVFCGPEDTSVLAGDQALVMEMAGRPFQVSAQSFFQVNSRQAEALVRYLSNILPITSSSTVLDIYCGVGLFSAFLASQAGRVIGVELSPSACEDFAVNLDEYSNVELYVGAAEEILPLLALKPDIVVVDPPRAGVDRAALQAIVNMQPSWLVYISCNPSTLARDASHLIEAGFYLDQVTPFDFFPQTYHIESFSVFRRTERT